MGEKETMWFKIGYAILCQGYKIVRPMFKKAIDNPDRTWDDILLQTVDTAMMYKK